MNTIDILKTHNAWRRGDDTRSMDDLGFNVTELGIAIDDAVRAISERDQLADQVERLREALETITSEAERCDSWEHFPSAPIELARLALDELRATNKTEYKPPAIQSSTPFAPLFADTNKSGGGDDLPVYTHPAPAAKVPDGWPHPTQIGALERNVKRNCPPEIFSVLERLIAAAPQPVEGEQ